MPFKLKRLSQRNLGHAQEKAEKYRDLNQPEEADSICRDILDIAPDFQPALRTLGLSLTDRYSGQWRRFHREALSVFGRLEVEYERVYYTGIAWERCAKAQLAEDGGGRGAYDAFMHALQLFKQAETLAPDGEPDPILRWNRCARALNTEPVLVAAAQEPHYPDIDFGDAPPGG